MSQKRFTDLPSEVNLPALLRSTYVELKQVEDALRQAEMELALAHQRASRLQAPRRAEELYREILALRDRSRRVLAELGEIWVNSS